MSSEKIATVKVYTMDACPYCEAAKRLLKQRNIAFEEIRVPLDDDAQWERLEKLSGMKTMPQIWAGDQLVGGYTDLKARDDQDQLANLLPK